MKPRQQTSFEMNQRIQDAECLVRRYLNTRYESAAMAYLAAQIEQASKEQE
jgi:hypothetical protein